MMKQDKNKLSDLLSQIEQLNEKYQIKQFIEDMKTVFKVINIDDTNIESFLKNPGTSIGHVVGDSLNPVDQQKFAKCLNQYQNLKKKYKYNSYMREGNALRKSFLDQRKHYIFNSCKFIKFTTIGKTSAIEKLSIDFAEQQFIAKWVDKLLKRIYPKTLTVEYEDLDGTIKTAELQHRRIIITRDYVEAPLIDRLFGEYLFDTFLLHSFYDVNTKSYIYLPIKFVVTLRSKDNNMFFEDNSI
jgi:hypothetical protein